MCPQCSTLRYAQGKRTELDCGAPQVLNKEDEEPDGVFEVLPHASKTGVGHPLKADSSLRSE